MTSKQLTKGHFERFIMAIKDMNEFTIRNIERNTVKTNNLGLKQTKLMNQAILKRKVEDNELLLREIEHGNVSLLWQIERTYIAISLLGMHCSKEEENMQYVCTIISLS